jgi:hypothetical protein
VEALGEAAVSVKIVYNPGSGNVTLTFKRGPLNFKPYWGGRVHDNLATSGGARERVVENLDILMTFDMPNLVVTDDLNAWGSFMQFGLLGGQFQFYPCDALGDFYDCVLEQTTFEPVRNAPAKYAAAVVVRILQNANAPTGPDIVVRRFYGITP